MFGYLLGRYGRGGSVWSEELKKLQQNLVKDEDRVSSMIQTGYDNLSPELKLVFLDVAVFLPRFLGDKKWISITDASDWLKSVHGSSGSNDQLVFDGMDRLKKLRKSSFLDWEKDGRMQIHDLIRDHAVKEVLVGKSAESRRCLLLDEDSGHERLAELSTAEAWSKVERIVLVRCGSESLAKMQWERCSAVKALYVEGCTQLKELRLGRMASLRVLEIHSCENVVKLEGLRRLDKLCHFRVDGCGKLFAGFWVGLFRPHIIGCLTSLATLKLSGTGLKEVPDLSAMSGLREFHLKDQDHLIGLPSLEMLTHLRSLRVESCNSLKTFPDLSRLTQLQELVVTDCSNVEQEFPDLSRLTQLQELKVSDYGDEGESLRELQGIENLAKLQKLYIQRMRLLKFPDFGSLTELRSLEIFCCQMPEEFPMEGFGNLVNLTVMNFSDAPFRVAREILDI